MHIQDEILNALVDGQLDVENRSIVEAHLAGCPACQEKQAEIRALSHQVEQSFALLDRANEPAFVMPDIAYRSFKKRLVEDNHKENSNMWQRLTKRISRPAWVTLAVVLLLAVSLTFAPVRAFANSFLGLFRVEQVRVIEVDFQDLAGKLGSSSNIENLISQNAQIESAGEIQAASSPEEASQMAGLAVRLPTGIADQPSLNVQPGGKVTFNIDLDLVMAVLKDLGENDIQLPRSLDGAMVTVDIPAAVLATYGECQVENDPQKMAADPDDPESMVVSDCTALLQMRAPSISAPPGLDISQIGQAYLQILGMEPSEAQRFAQNVDWSSTFVIPIPRYNASYMDVTVEGVKGTLITHRSGQYIVLWLKDGLLYALSGPGDADLALELANSIR